MEAIKLYRQLEKGFITPKMSDEWAEEMGSVADFLSDNFKKRSMGLVCDFAAEINKVYTAVFPSNKVLNEILKSKTENAMLFVHHPAVWDIRKAPEVFRQMDRSLLQKLKEQKISVYNLHVPLDNYGKYSTSVSLAKATDIKPKKAFAPYFGALCGVFGKTGLICIDELKAKFESAVGHKVSLYNYGDKQIKNKIVAVIAGGGNDEKLLKDIAKEGVNTFITGITAKNEHSRKAHEFAEKHRINILGGTHYSTEKFACMAMCDYFKKKGLPSEFIGDNPVMEDM
jgi:putative NIF3 family GTP cyclohydrolase 1 type 2